MVETEQATARTTLSQTFDGETGFFKQWESSSDSFKPDWLVGSGDTLDKLFYVFHSGNKRLGPGMLSSAKTFTTWKDVYDYFVPMIVSLFKQTWTRRWEALTEQYDILSPKNYMDEEVRDLKTGRNTKASMKTTTTTNGAQNDGAFGFNSDQSVGSGSRNVNNTETVTGDADDNVTTEDFTDTGKVTRTIKGNDGKYLPSDIVGRELELAKNNFLESVFEDVDSVLANPLY